MTVSVDGREGGGRRARASVRRLLPLDPNDMRVTGQVPCPRKDSSIARQRCVEFQREVGCVCPAGEKAWSLEAQHRRDVREEEALREAATARYRAEYRANGAERQVRLRREPGETCVCCGKKPRRRGRATCSKRCERAARAAGGALSVKSMTPQQLSDRSKAAAASRFGDAIRVRRSGDAGVYQRERRPT